MAATIIALKAREVLDGCGKPTVEVEVILSDGRVVRAALSSDASSGIDDGGPDYHRARINKAVEKINTVIGPALHGEDPSDQGGIDNFLVQQFHESGWCKRSLGSNAMLSVSVAVCKAGATSLNIPLYKHIANIAGIQNLCLPLPQFSILIGGSRSGNKLFMREVMIIPIGAKSLKEAIQIGVEIYDVLKCMIKKEYGQDSAYVGVEGCFAPNIQENMVVFDMIKRAIKEAGYTEQVVIGMDAGASDFYRDDKTYDLNYKEKNIGFRKCMYAFFRELILRYNECTEKISGEQLIDLYKSFVSEYSVASIEDPFAQDDWEHYAMMTEECSEKAQIVGGNLLLSNRERLMKAINEKTCNALLLKVEELDTVTGIIEAVTMSKNAGWGVIASHCSGETEDTFIADLSVGLATGQIKTGAPCRSEHLAKYNQVDEPEPPTHFLADKY